MGKEIYGYERVKLADFARTGVTFPSLSSTQRFTFRCGQLTAALRKVPEYFKNIQVGKSIGPVDFAGDAPLCIRSSGHTRAIDVINSFAIDGSYKTKGQLAEEITQKISMHLLAETTENILITASGCKFDLRKLTEHRVEVDSLGYLRVNGLRIVTTSHLGYFVLSAHRIHSYTIFRLFQSHENKQLCLCDDMTLCGNEKRGFMIKVNDPLDLSSEYVSGADPNYLGLYYHMHVFTLSSSEQTEFQHLLESYPIP